MFFKRGRFQIPEAIAFPSGGDPADASSSSSSRRVMGIARPDYGRGNDDAHSVDGGSEDDNEEDVEDDNKEDDEEEEPSYESSLSTANPPQIVHALHRPHHPDDTLSSIRDVDTTRSSIPDDDGSLHGPMHGPDSSRDLDSHEASLLEANDEEEEAADAALPGDGGPHASSPDGPSGGALGAAVARKDREVGGNNDASTSPNCVIDMSGVVVGGGEESRYATALGGDDDMGGGGGERTVEDCSPLAPRKIDLSCRSDGVPAAEQPGTKSTSPPPVGHPSSSRAERPEIQGGGEGGAGNSAKLYEVTGKLARKCTKLQKKIESRDGKIRELEISRGTLLEKMRAARHRDERTQQSYHRLFVKMCAKHEKEKEALRADVAQGDEDLTEMTDVIERLMEANAKLEDALRAVSSITRMRGERAIELVDLRRQLKEKNATIEQLDARNKSLSDRLEANRQDLRDEIRKHVVESEVERTMRRMLRDALLQEQHGAGSCSCPGSPQAEAETITCNDLEEKLSQVVQTSVMLCIEEMCMVVGGACR